MTQAMAARELLDLENRAMHDSSINLFCERWFELAAIIFNPCQWELHRKSFRIPANIEGKLEHNGESISCRVSEVSLANVTCSGANLLKIAVGDIASLISGGEMQGKKIEMTARRVFLLNAVPAVGFEFKESSDPLVQDLYYKKVYKPAFIRYIEAVSEKA